MTTDNLVLMTDSYKVSHWKQYPPGTTNVYSYYESRGGRYPFTVFFGLQYYLQRYLANCVESWDLDEAEEVYNAHLGPGVFNREGWEYILNEHGGFLPLEIKAVPEGTRVPVSNVLMTVENTDPNCFWLTNWMETVLCQLWYPITVATQSVDLRDKMELCALRQGADVAGVPFKLHDFGFRGVSSTESAGIGGLAHLVAFLGTDTVAALTCGRDYYGSDCAGFSIPAAEHSTITSWGRENEVEAFRNMIRQYGDGALYAVVSDSYDIFAACEGLWGTELRDEVLNANGTLVVRPDSGNPVHVVTRVLDILGGKFGFTTLPNGLRVLNPKVRVIQGDGVNPTSIMDILSAMEANGWSIDNIAFGMGGALLQKLDRDTQKFAFKCSSVIVDGEERDVYKQPVTSSMKVSKRGRLGLEFSVENGYVTTTEEHNTELRTVFRDGELFNVETLDEIRARLWD